MSAIRNQVGLASALLLAPVFVVVMVSLGIRDPSPRVDRPLVGLVSLCTGWLLVALLSGPRPSMTPLRRLRRARLGFAAVTVPAVLAPLGFGLHHETVGLPALWDSAVLPIWQGAMMGLCVGAGIALRVASVHARAAAAKEAASTTHAPPSPRN